MSKCEKCGGVGLDMRVRFLDEEERHHDEPLPKCGTCGGSGVVEGADLAKLAATDDKIREAAAKKWAREGEVEIDADAKVSRSVYPDGEELGAYVQAWVWVDFPLDE